MEEIYLLRIRKFLVCYYENKRSGQIWSITIRCTPEVLHGENYSAASDIYSFNIIMNILTNGKRFELMILV
jgi:serine/threonine protein kinase